MSISRNIQRSVQAVALLAVFGAAPVAAQTVTADDLTVRAKSLYETPARYREAAELHVKAAALRPTDDLQRIEDLTMAARLFTYAGYPDEGRFSAEQAAWTALANGDFATAGHVYVDAAFMARDANDKGSVRRLLHAAQWIAEAPTLAAPDQQELRRRMTGDRAVAQN